MGGHSPAIESRWRLRHRTRANVCFLGDFVIALVVDPLQNLNSIRSHPLTGANVLNRFPVRFFRLILGLSLCFASVACHGTGCH